MRDAVSCNAIKCDAMTMGLGWSRVQKDEAVMQVRLVMRFEVCMALDGSPTHGDAWRRGWDNGGYGISGCGHNELRQ
jgi:hypothetical protein